MTNSKKRNIEINPKEWTSLSLTNETLIKLRSLEISRKESNEHLLNRIINLIKNGKKI